MFVDVVAKTIHNGNTENDYRGPTFRLLHVVHMIYALQGLNHHELSQ